MYVYGIGDHLLDMLCWHPGLAGRVERLFDKNPSKIGMKLEELDIVIEPAEALGSLPDNSYVVIAAIRYFDEIAADIGKINPALRCLNIDDAWDMALLPDGDHPHLGFGERTKEIEELAARLREEVERRHEACV